MADQPAKKHHSPVDRVKEVSGIYGLGFDKDSFMGFSLPFIIVILIGGVGGVLIWKWL
jgi:hypothetical protein